MSKPRSGKNARAIVTARTRPGLCALCGLNRATPKLKLSHPSERRKEFALADLREEGITDQMKGRIRSTWGAVTDDDVEQAQGNLEKLVGKIKEKTGETTDSIRDKLDQLRSDGNN